MNISKLRLLPCGIIVLALAACLLAAPPDPQGLTLPVGTIGPASVIHPAPPDYKFPNGLVLEYGAEWRLLKAGTATLRLNDTGTEAHVSASGDSIGVVAMLFRVQDRFDSYFDRRTFCSTHITKHTEEGSHQRNTEIRFDPVRRKAVLDERNLRNGESKHVEQDIPGCVTDVLSGIYYLGSLPLTLGGTYTFPLNDGGKTVNVRAVVEAREEIKTDAGTFRTLRVQPSSDSGLLKNRGKLWLWYTDDPSHMLVYVRTKLLWGTLNISLVRVEHTTRP